MPYPAIRMRRLRSSEPIRTLVRETRLSPSQFVYPLFVCPGEEVRHEVKSMPGVYNLSVDEAVKEAHEAKSLGIGALILFGIPDHKDENASGAWDQGGIVQRAVRAIKSEVPDLPVIGDVCLCEYMSHGHCGVIRNSFGQTGLQSAGRSTISAADGKEESKWEVDNDSSLKLLARTAVSMAEAGIDIVAPSDMMDGRVAALRAALDSAGHQGIPILSYAAKVASAFYGPFREAADSAPQFGDRRSYQMDGANFREAMREIELDIEEGADMVMVKPAMPYLDFIHAARQRFDLPIAAYQVSGEYAMLEAAFRNGWLDRDRTILEALTSIRRAGADIIITYFAKIAARLL